MTDWSKIATFYRGLIEHGWNMKPMLELVLAIEQSDETRGLSAVTSHDALRLSVSPENLARGVDMLRIEYTKHAVAFAFWEESFMPIAWERHCAPEDAFVTLRHFVVDLKHWWRP